MMKRLLMPILLGVLFLFGARAEVVVTDFVCYDFARAVLGSEEELTMLIKPGTEAHTFEPTPAQMLSVGKADLMLCIGGESEVWVDSMFDSLGSDAPERLKLMDCVALLEEESEDAAETEMDEHIWTSPRNAMAMLRAVEDAFCAIYPEREAELRANAEGYANRISALDEQLREMVENAAHATIVVADRFPFLYLTHDYGIAYQAAFASCTSQTEPNPARLKALIETVAKENLSCIYIIEMSSGNVAKTVAEETGAKILSLHSMQTVTQEEFDAGLTYVDLMTDNVEALKEGLL